MCAKYRYRVESSLSWTNSQISPKGYLAVWVGVFGRTWPAQAETCFDKCQTCSGSQTARDSISFYIEVLHLVLSFSSWPTMCWYHFETFLGTQKSLKKGTQPKTNMSLNRSHSKRKFHPTAIFHGTCWIRGGVDIEIQTKILANTQLELQKDLKPNANDLLLHMQLAKHCRQWHLEGHFFPWAKRRWTRQPCSQKILRNADGDVIYRTTEGMYKNLHKSQVFIPAIGKLVLIQSPRTVHLYACHVEIYEFFRSWQAMYIIHFGQTLLYVTKPKSMQKESS